MEAENDIDVLIDLLRKSAKVKERKVSEKPARVFCAWPLSSLEKPLMMHDCVPRSVSGCPGAPQQLAREL